MATLPSISKPSRPLMIHHLKIPASDLTKTYGFYTKILPFQAIPSLNHYTTSGELYGAIFSNGADLFVEIRQDAQQAAVQRGFDPITWGVPTRKDLKEWAAWLSSQGVNHSRILTGVKGWVLCFEDPDGKFIRLYTTEEEHEWCEPDKDDYWLKTPN
ncbi:Glyoxalase/Bleomycin resistance protein/Dihydroxybiphenyl dioxygenase [Xylaria sp. FL0064]|nr:Glyoxalase/Bleomycin resistance protein/Dihydroxybiphenyl dioxygenase [Xylaria sp. FL0064]